MDKYTLPLSLNIAKPDDAALLYSWFSSLKDMRDWGGPHMDYPLPLDNFISLVKFSELNSFKLVDDEQKMLAFGQFYPRLGRTHFGRIAVSPKHRQQGLGRELMTRLIEQASTFKNTNGYSLFVMDDNHGAKQLYVSLGFVTAGYPDPLGENWDSCEYMIRD